jgi:hypothetical protein
MASTAVPCEKGLTIRHSTYYPLTAEPRVSERMQCPALRAELRLPLGHMIRGGQPSICGGTAKLRSAGSNSDPGFRQRLIRATLVCTNWCLGSKCRTMDDELSSIRRMPVRRDPL